LRLPLSDIKTGSSGFWDLIRFFHRLEGVEDDVIDIDMADVNWIDANMCSPLGAILSLKEKRGRQIVMSNLHDSQRDILSRNHFLSEFGGTEDHRGTTIEFRRFECSSLGTGAFQEYVSAFFQPASKGLPAMSDLLLKRFRESLYEIFENAREHSDSQNRIFACGQLYPRKSRLDFTITDLGIGIEGSIKKNLGLDLTSSRAIEWAVRGNTTRCGRTGGLGLLLLQEFIRLNRGRLIIVSKRGYWECSQMGVEGATFSSSFPGTSVTIEVNTADRSSYRLASEIDPASIF